MIIPGKSAKSAIARFWSVSVVWPTMLLVLFSTSVKSADIKIEVVDPSTGKTISTYEKTYSPAKKEQIQEKVGEKRVAEDVPSGLAKKVELEKRELPERVDQVQSESARPGNPTDVGEPRPLDRQTDALIKNPEYRFYKKELSSQESQSARSESTPSPVSGTPKPIINSDTGRVVNASNVRRDSTSETLLKGVGIKVVAPLIFAALGFVLVVVKAFPKVTYSKALKPIVDSQYAKEIRNEMRKDLKAKDVGRKRPRWSALAPSRKQGGFYAGLVSSD